MEHFSLTNPEEGPPHAATGFPSAPLIAPDARAFLVIVGARVFAAPPALRGTGPAVVGLAREAEAGRPPAAL